jgi:7-cyano-7-deazaguanine reductase
MNERIDSVLGQKVSAPEQYTSSILVRERRLSNRKQYGLENENLPFVGVDVWNCYEISFLTSRGLPISCAGKITYSCTNEYIVESKSLKLYLNSFNMFRTSSSKKEESITEISSLIEKDLSSLLETEVKVHLFLEAVNNPVLTDYVDIETFEDFEKTEFVDFEESPQLLKLVDTEEVIEEDLKSNLLRSNCKITHQPDWGTLFLHYKADKKYLDLSSLAQYLVSFRKENHFHEEVCEMIFKRLYDILNPIELAVTCIYTRRGGIDICPMRATHEHLLDKNLSNVNIHCMKELRQ